MACLRVSLALFAALVTGCMPPGSSQPSVVQSKDGSTQVRVPAGWVKATDLNDEADLQVANRRDNAFFIVLSEPKSDFGADIDYRAHAKLTLNHIMDAVTNPEVTGPTALRVGGLPAVQYVVQGNVKALRIVYLHTTVEGKETFHQLLGWTTPSRLDRNRPVLEGIIASFTETK